MSVETIRVTQHHIDAGIRGSCHWCPVALAIMDAFAVNSARAESHALVFGGGVFVSPQVVTDFITCFDTRAVRRPRPFSFELDVPDAIPRRMQP